MHVPMSSPDLTDLEREAVAAVLRTPNLSMGGEILAFEEIFRKYTGSKYAIGVSSGTAGLHLCVRAAGIGDQGGASTDLVITTPFSFVASSNVLLFERAVPIFVDVDPQTGNISVEQVKAATRDLMSGGVAARKWLPRRGTAMRYQLKALLPVHVFGQPADMDPLIEIGQSYSLPIIEDACEALGARYRDCLAGTFGNYGVFAFYPNKQITTGEGAVIITNDEQAANLMNALRNQGRAPGDTWLQHTHLGYNYRLDEMSAALGRVQMNRIQELIANRERVAEWYTERLGEIPGLEVPTLVPSTTCMSWFVYVVRFAPGIDRDGVARRLGEQRIPARPYFLPIHLQPYMVTRFGYQPGDFPVTEDLGQRGLALPFSGVMSEAQVDIVYRALGEILSS
ncbi:MAG: polysaccharide biosynthesis protein [Chloroflexi bacterium RBG_16_52_11]|nr:MAG: polysaccharide biosynthesis protein [Chloroflexi bacterium RBG_16_52_11]